MSVLQVVGAVIIRDGKVFCARRSDDGPAGGKWEFPGGKVEPSESPEEALRREVREELLIDVVVGPRFTTTQLVIGDLVGETEPRPDGAELITFVCSLAPGWEPIAIEHQDTCWLRPSELHRLDWAEPDLPTVELLAMAAERGINFAVTKG